jgi:hypothetical protein
MDIAEIAEKRVLYLDSDGPLIERPDQANDLIGDAWGHEATVIAVPATRLDPEFFRLSSGLAGEITQKLVNYRFVFAVLGDISQYLEASGALRDYVWESNRGSHVWFVAGRTEFEAKLAAHAVR